MKMLDRTRFKNIRRCLTKSFTPERSCGADILMEMNGGRQWFYLHPAIRKRTTDSFMPKLSKKVNAAVSIILEWRFCLVRIFEEELAAVWRYKRQDAVYMPRPTKA